MQPGRSNNFDIIRLFAALQVVIMHALTHFGYEESFLRSILSFFPGVPIFFFVSGFLISQSFDRSTTLLSYFRKRALRIFPALWVVTLITIIAIFLSGYFNEVKWSLTNLLLWVLGQTTIVQFYNPGFFRDFGVGVVNGALWTISVELQFYILMPLLATIFSFSRSVYLLLLSGIFVFALLYLQIILPAYEDYLVSKLTYVTFLPWVGIFMLGHLCSKYWEKIRPLIEGKFLIWISLYVLISTIAVRLEDFIGTQISGNRIVFPIMVLLIGLVLSAAYTKPNLSEKFLKGQDVSYGVYLYHLPIINFWIYFGFRQDAIGITMCVILALCFALFSWFLVEKPALKFKVNPMRKV